MAAYSIALGVISSVLAAALILRAERGVFLYRFPLFYSYLAYMLGGSAIAQMLSLLRPQYYAIAFWFYFLLSLLAEFAVLLEISDHIFGPYPLIRRLGRFLAVSICAAFLFLYIIPSLMEHRPSSVAILDLVKRVSLAKAVIIIVLLAAARRFRLPLGKNISGMMLGFSIYLAINVANFALAEKYGPALYGQTFSVVGPLSYTLGLAVWTVSLWRYEPAMQVSRKYHDDEEEISTPLSYQLGRFNTALMRLLRR